MIVHSVATYDATLIYSVLQRMNKFLRRSSKAASRLAHAHCGKTGLMMSCNLTANKDVVSLTHISRADQLSFVRHGRRARKHKHRDSCSGDIMDRAGPAKDQILSINLESRCMKKSLHSQGASIDVNNYRLHLP